ncbi:MAG: DUF2914 domain-containing protein [Candidatus Vogelbacteria bacterium]|nr:DUF2914 domain-containing protein [Candidatus Vogelbacteria bacterium]
MIKRVGDWYGRYERHISSIGLIAGFVFDAVKLKRVDLFWENVWVLAHLLVAAAGLVVLNYYLNRPGRAGEEYRLYTFQFWLIFIIQFAFGGLLSTFLVFYFRSSTLAASWPFLLLLAGVFIGNEIFKKHYARLSYQISVLFFSIFAFAIFIVPVIVHRISDGVFILSGLVSLAAIGGFVWLLKYLTREKFYQSKKILMYSIAGVYLAVNLLYFFNLIPPIPLSLKEAGAYHSISKNVAGNYVATAEPASFWNWFRRYDPIHVVLGAPVYAYSAVFSPTALNVDIVHVWQYYDESTRDWVTLSRINLPVVGGRDDGYRTYSMKRGLAPGRWRVNVETPRGQVIGRIRFKVEPVKEFASWPVVLLE